MKDKLIQLLELCIEKELVYEFSPQHELMSVREFDENSNIIFQAEEWKINEEKISKLIGKVKNYKK